TGVAVDEIGNIALPRDTRLTLQAFVPTRTQSVALTWPAEYGTLVLRQMGVDMPYTGYLTGQSSGAIPVAGGVVQSDWATLGGYIPVGFDHILPKGLDHILFVLGLFFLAPRIRPLLWQVTAFTLAHSITLTLAALGLVQVPGHIVEPLIAASIVYVAIENLTSDRISTWRPVVIFGFGLLHGLGFASVLADFGLPDGQYLPALLGFNIGVEVGQLTVLLGIFLLVWVALMVDRRRIDKLVGQGVYAALALTFVALRFILDTPSYAEQMGDGPEAFFVPLAFVAMLCFYAVSRVETVQDPYRKLVAIPCSIGIALIGVFWVIERVFL
ncbi:MAG: HupE/UreJ family protein, partial [Paracoccaceae bacterium]